MGLRINTNVDHIQTRHRLEQSTGKLNRTLQRLATGRRIARAADDAAGTAISGRITARIASMDRAARNAQDGMNLAATAEGGLAEIGRTLERMRELAVAAGNGTHTDAGKDALQAEFAALRDHMDQLAEGTTFNGILLLDGGSTITLQVGSDTTSGVDTLDLDLTAVTASDLSLAAVDIGSSGDPSAAIAALDAAIDTVSAEREDLGATMNRLDALIRATGTAEEQQAGVRSRIVDADVAHETAALTRDGILQESGIAALVQANNTPLLALSLLQLGQ